MSPDGSRVCVVGLWHLGLVTTAGLAELGWRVTATDVDAELVRAMASGRLPLREPGLEESLSAATSTGRLRWSADIREAVATAPVVWLAVDVPVDEDDRGRPESLDDLVGSLAGHVAHGAILAVSSQVPVGTCRRWRGLLATAGRPDVQVAYLPENLRLGHGLERFRRPDLLVVGATDHTVIAPLYDLLAPIGMPPIPVDLETAEMVKHAINAFLGMSITFGNELGDLCEAVGADGEAVVRAMRQDPRIGTGARIAAGLGFSGGTLARDIGYLHDAGLRLAVATPMLDTTLSANASRTGRLVNALAGHVGLAGATIGVLGLTYTAGTSTLRRSGPLAVALDIVRRGAKVQAFDALAEASPGQDGIVRSPTALDAATGADALLILNASQSRSEIDLAAFAAAMRGRLIVDAASAIDPAAARAVGLTLLRPGVSVKSPGGTPRCASA